ncbi:MAG: hypothetical protein AAFP19_03300 [Bacteroidota bacterium]
MTHLNRPLTNLQIELLKIYSFDISEEQLMEIKDILSRYFADKATGEMDQLWEEKGWSNETMDNWLKGEE